MSTHPARHEQLASRVARIRMPLGAIAEAAPADPMTVSRTLTGKTEPLVSTLDKIERAVAAEEIRLRDHLLKIHPLTGNDHDARTAA